MPWRYFSLRTFLLTHHYLKLHLHWLLSRTLNPYSNIPLACHREPFTTCEDGHIGRVATFNRLLCYAHIHYLHVGAELHLRIRHRPASTILKCYRHGIRLCDTRRSYSQRDREIARGLCLRIR